VIPRYFELRYALFVPLNSLLLLEKRLGPMRWGFVPEVAKDPKLAPIDARAETLATSSMFRDAFRRHRCLVVADGFYEWRNDGRPKTPFFIRLSAESRPSSRRATSPRGHPLRAPRR
jgi:putative SOS response-associated peptidase YedK